MTRVNLADMRNINSPASVASRTPRVVVRQEQPGLSGIHWSSCVPDKTVCFCRTITRSVRLATEGRVVDAEHVSQAHPCYTCRTAEYLLWGLQPCFDISGGHIRKHHFVPWVQNQHINNEILWKIIA